MTFIFCEKKNTLIHNLFPDSNIISNIVQIYNSPQKTFGRNSDHEYKIISRIFKRRHL